MKNLRVSLAWLLVGIPLAWGVTRSVQKALPLFKTSPSTQTHSTTTPPSR